MRRSSGRQCPEVGLCVGVGGAVVGVGLDGGCGDAERFGVGSGWLLEVGRPVVGEAGRVRGSDAAVAPVGSSLAGSLAAGDASCRVAGSVAAESGEVSAALGDRPVACVCGTARALRRFPVPWLVVAASWVRSAGVSRVRSAGVSRVRSARATSWRVRVGRRFASACVVAVTTVCGSGATASVWCGRWPAPSVAETMATVAHAPAAVAVTIATGRRAAVPPMAACSAPS